MAKWPKSETWYDGVRKEFRFENGYIISLVRFTGSYGYKQGLWELAIMNKDGDFEDPPYEEVLKVLDDYRQADPGIYGYLNDPEADRIIRIVEKIDASEIRTKCS